LEKCQCSRRLHGNSPALLPYALLEAIGRDEALLDPSELFKKSEAQGEIDSEDAAYWNVELTEPEGEALAAEDAASVLQIELQPALESDPLIWEAIRLGGVVAEIERQPLELNRAGEQVLHTPVTEAIIRYLDGVHIIADEQTPSTLRAELLSLLQAGSARLRDWLRENRVVFPGCEAEVAAHIIRLAQGTNRDPVNVIPLRPAAVSAKSRKSAASKTRRLDLLAAPDDAPEPQHQRQHREQVDETAPLQLALF
jgi:hypothetical protein